MPAYFYSAPMRKEYSITLRGSQYFLLKITVSDVLSLILKMDEQLDMNFEAERYEDGSFNPSTIKIILFNCGGIDAGKLTERFL